MVADTEHLGVIEAWILTLGGFIEFLPGVGTKGFATELREIAVYLILIF